MEFRVSRAVAFALAVFASASAIAGESAPTATAVQLVDRDGAARLTLDLTAPVAATARPVLYPDRILIDLPEVVFRAGRGLPASGREGRRRAGRGCPVWLAGSG